MDLRITIQDENNDILEEVVVYQEGSDSQGAFDIIKMIEDRFETDEDRH